MNQNQNNSKNNVKVQSLWRHVRYINAIQMLRIFRKCLNDTESNTISKEQALKLLEQAIDEPDYIFIKVDPETLNKYEELD